MSSVWDHENLIMRGRCAFCLSEETTPVAERADGLKIFECRSCGLAYVDPHPTSAQLRNYYDKDYFTGKKDFFANSNYCYERDNALKEGRITGYGEIISVFEIRSKVILEIGCGTGSLLAALSSHNPLKLVGIDFAEYPISYSRKKYNLDLRCTSLEFANFQSSYFDLVIMIDLIEHVEDMHNFMDELKRVLKPDGHIFLITPNYTAFTLAKDNWICLYKDFEHLQYFSPASLTEIGKRVGFTVCKWWTKGIAVKLERYPIPTSANGIHRILYPQIAIRNLYRKLRYSPVHGRRRNLGYDLYAILAKEP